VAGCGDVAITDNRTVAIKITSKTKSTIETTSVVAPVCPGSPHRGYDGRRQDQRDEGKPEKEVKHDKFSHNTLPY
jgi:hypothetical protein